jgi:hypothetical protein
VIVSDESPSNWMSGGEIGILSDAIFLALLSNVSQ